MRRLPSRLLVPLAAMAVLAISCGDTAGDPPSTSATATAAPSPATSAVPAEPPGTTTTTAPLQPMDQATAGAGWRLLADETVGRPYQVSVALSQEALQRMWSYHGFATPVPSLDVDREIAVLLTQAVGSSCPEIRLADLVIAGDLVFGEFAYPVVYNACTADATPHSYVLAVERAVLPDAFTLQLTEELVCGGCDDDSLDVDLADPSLDERLWGFGRILVVREGPPPAFPEVSFGYAAPSYGPTRSWAAESPRDAPMLVHVIEPAQGSYVLDAGRVDCAAGDCGDTQPQLIDPCRAFVEAEPGADVWAIYTISPAGTCTWRTADAYELPEIEG